MSYKDIKMISIGVDTNVIKTNNITKKNSCQLGQQTMMAIDFEQPFMVEVIRISLSCQIKGC